MGGESYTVTLDVDVSDRLPNDWPPEKIEREIRGSIDGEYSALTVGDVTIEPDPHVAGDDETGGGDA